MSDCWRVLRAPGAYQQEDEPRGPPDAVDRLVRAFAALVDEQDDDARHILSAATNGSQHPPWAAFSLTLHALLAARLGSAGASELQRDAERAAQGHEDAAPWVALGRSLLDFEIGARTRSHAGLVDVSDEFSRQEIPVGSLFALIWAGRIELLLGRVAQGRARLAVSAETARRVGLGALAEMAARSEALELLPTPSRPRGEPVPPGRRSLLMREKAIEAFTMAASGTDETLAEALLEAAWREADGADYTVERLIVTAGRAFLERRRGALSALRERLREAARLAAENGVDTSHYLTLAKLVAQEQLIHEGRRRFFSPREPGLEAFEIVLDARRHELRAGLQVLSFRRKPVVRKLFYALAAHVGRPLTKDALARAAWGQDYNPLIHEDGLRVNIQHLRRTIERLGLSLWFDDIGYRLDVPSGFAFVETITDPIR